MVHIQSVHVSPIFQKEVRNFDIGGEVQRRLSISASCVHNIRVRRYKLLQFRHHSEPRSRVRINHRAAFDEEIN